MGEGGGYAVANVSEAFSHLLVRGFIDSDSSIPTFFQDFVRSLQPIQEIDSILQIVS
jgi:hypothetical protein